MRRDVFQAIADPTRRAIIGMIAAKPLHLNAIADKFNVTRPAISQHIKILEECGLVHVRKQGRERFCEVQLSELKVIDDWIEPFRKLWEERFAALDQLLEQMKKRS